MADDLITTALKRFKLASDAESDIRKKSLEDLKFRAGQQWPADRLASRAEQNSPCLTINQIPKFIRQVTNDARQNRPAIKISPTDESTKDTAEIIEGMMRHIEVSSDADIAYDTACDNQVTMGFGYLRIITDYCDENSFDQDIKIKRVKNPFTVYFDPSAVEPDYSDAKWCFIVSDVDKNEFKQEYPAASASNLALESTGDAPQDWMTEDNIRIAEYFRVIETKKTIYMMSDGSVIDDEKFKALNGQPIQAKAKRETTVRTVKWSKITAFEELESGDWAGKWIPVIPVLGDDLDIDGKRQLTGMVRDIQDPQRMYNYWTSAFTEAIALAPKAPYIMAEGQDEGYEGIWNNANIKNYPYIVYKPVTIGGNLAPEPRRNNAEPPVQAMAAAIAQAGNDLKSITGIYDANLGQRSNETSGKAILARQKQGDTSNFHYIDNLSRSIRHLGVILLDLIPKIYDAPRIVRIVHEDRTHDMVKINQPSGEQDENGAQKIYDVTTGKYDVVVETGPSYNTKRQESAAGMQALIQAYPDIMKVAGDIFVKNMDFPQSGDIANRIKAILPPQIQQQEDADMPVPPQIAQQLHQSGQMIEQLTGELNKAKDIIQTKTMELESKERIAYAGYENNLTIEAMKAEISNNMTLFTEELKHIRESQAMINQNFQAMQPLAQPAPQGEQVSNPNG